MTLAKWMDQVDEACSTERDMLIYHLPEVEFHVAYKCGSSPQEFVARVVSNAHEVPMMFDQPFT